MAHTEKGGFNLLNIIARRPLNQEAQMGPVSVTSSGAEWSFLFGLVRVINGTETSIFGKKHEFILDIAGQNVLRRSKRK